MKVFKATLADMTCTMGIGTFQYRLGVPAEAESSRCGSTGLHACEYIADCAGYYPLGNGNRYFLAEAEGDIAEDGCNTRISCTRLTLTRELTRRDIAREAMFYMMRHPKRAGWSTKRHMLDISPDCAEAVLPDGIAIARGKDPRVRGCPGSFLGLILEDGEGIHAARLAMADGNLIQPWVWYSLEELIKITEKITEQKREG